MTERRRNSSSTKKVMDAYNYAMYMPDDASPEEIEARFNFYEEQLNKNQGEDQETIARKVFQQTATPNQVPMDIWWSMENEPDDNDEKFDFTFRPGYDDDDFVERRRGVSTSRPKSKSSKAKNGLVTAAQQIEHLGAGVDLWPLYKVLQYDVPPHLTIIQDFTNKESINPRQTIAEMIENNPINMVNRITAKVIKDIIPGPIDAIIMDVPFGHNDWTFSRFQSLILNLNRYLERTFLIVWADPENLELIQEVFDKSEYVFCDSITIELLDSTGGPYFYPPDKFGFRRETRMAIMFRTDDINRSDLKQQRVKDTGYGTVYENGKSYGRLGMPLCIHEIIEIMLPDLPKRKRTFVELWPSFYTRRDGWINIDEKVNPEEELPDEFLPEDSRHPVQTYHFDDSLINRIDKRGSSGRNVEHKQNKGVVIENDSNDKDDDVDVSEIIERKMQQRSQTEIESSSSADEDSDLD